MSTLGSFQVFGKNIVVGKLQIKSWFVGVSLIYVLSVYFTKTSLITFMPPAPPQPHGGSPGRWQWRTSPGHTAVAALAHCGSGGFRPRGGGDGPLRLERPQAPRQRRWPLAVRAAPPIHIRDEITINTTNQIVFATSFHQNCRGCKCDLSLPLYISPSLSLSLSLSVSLSKYVCIYTHVYAHISLSMSLCHRLDMYVYIYIYTYAYGNRRLDLDRT